MEGRAIKLQRYDFSGRDSRLGRNRGYNPKRHGNALLRYGTLAGLMVLAVAFAKRGGHGKGTILSQKPVAIAGIVGAKPSTPAASVPGPSLKSAHLDYFSPFRRFPLPDTFAISGRTVVAEYLADSLLHAHIGMYLHRYQPEHAVILACDLETGNMLGVGERTDSLVIGVPRMAFRGGFPAASLIKILTATAAFETQGRSPEDSITQLGGYYTLYRRQLKVGPHDRGKVSLTDAFSRSINPAFGLLGLGMGGETLRRQGERMGFNRELACLKPSVYNPPDTGYNLAEAACGFTPKTTISPMHALAIARGAGHDGRVRLGSFARLSDITRPGTRHELDAVSDTGIAFVSPANLPRLQALMEGTIRKGTARKGFHQVLRASHMQKIEIGGKTGSLDGEEPKGRYDWFIGYARLKDEPRKGIALAVMLVHGTYASQRSTVLAALLVRDWLVAQEKARKRPAEPTAVTGASRAEGATEVLAAAPDPHDTRDP